MRASAVSLAVGYVLFGVAALVAFAAPLWYAWQVSVSDYRTAILQEDSDRLTEVFNRGGVTRLVNFIDERVGLQIAGERILLLTAPTGEVLAGNLDRWPASLPQQSGVYTVPVVLDGKPTPTFVVRTALPGGYNMLVGRDLARYTSVENDFWLGLTAAVAILLVVAVLGAVLIRREVLARIHGIQQTASAIMQGELSHRLRSGGGPQELDALSQTINRMLDQIEQLVHGIRNVSNSIAHDLRTPLAELRSRLEELSVTRPPPAETQTEIEGAVADVDRVIGIFNALLRLAEIDTGLRRAGFVAVDLAEVAAEAVEFWLPAAEVKGVALAWDGQAPLPVSGDPLLLAQALSNLIDNAVKYAPAGRGSIVVGARRLDNGGVELSVADNGPGIPDAEKPRAPERFFRGDASRASPGVGLGLSIVEAVARLHGGSLRLEDNHPGLRVHLRLGTEIVALSAPG